jgi:AbrB family looped-hinge helix DNA binding protein
MKAMAPTLTKITRNYQVTIPPAARRALKLKVGDFVEASPRRDGVLLRPTKLVTPETFEHELSRRLSAALADAKAGRLSRPFATADEAIAHLHREARRLKQRSRKR